MRGWTRGFCFILLVSVIAAGCGSSSSSSSTIAISPTSVTLLVNSQFQFAASVSSTTTAVTWSVGGVTGGNATVGTITTGGLYTAPATVPPAGTGVTVTTATPPTTTVTVTATQGSNSASATVTLDSGVRLSISPGTATIGTGETLLLTANVTGVPTGGSSAVTWTASSGTIDPNTGIFTAPAAAGSSTITAKSVFDTTQTATATVTSVVAADPTITSVGPATGPTIGAVGAAFQDVYLTGTNFLSTTTVFINGVVPPNLTTAASSTTLLVRVPDSSLATPGTLTFTIARQGGAPQSCPVPANCQLVLSEVRPAIVGATPDSIALPTAGASPAFNVDGGYFGAAGPPTVASVHAEFNGVPEAPTLNSSRQLGVTIQSSDVGAGGGSYPVAVVDQSPGTQRAVTNLAVQPALSGTVTATLPVGTAPAAVAINAATGIAVVANQGSNDVALIDLTAASPAVIGYICSGVLNAPLNATSTACAAASAPVSVAVDDVRNIALVANSGTSNVSVIDLNAKIVSAIVPSVTGITGIPAAVGVNPRTGLGIVAYRTAGFASLLNLTTTPPTVTGIVTLSNGATPHIAVSSKLDWAFVTPGGVGSLAIVDLAQTTSVALSSAPNSASKTGGTATITTATAHGLQVGEAVLISGMSDTTFNGVFTVLSVPTSTTFTFALTGTGTATGGTIIHSLPVATLAVNASIGGAAFNDETQKAILVDTAVANATILNALDQSSGGVALPQNPGNVAAAVNPLTNVGVVVNQTSNVAEVVDPTGATSTTQFAVGNHPMDVAIDPGTNLAVIVNQLSNNVSIASLGAIRSPQIVQVAGSSQTPLADLTVGSSLATAPTYSNQTFTIIGKGFTGASVPRLDADTTGVQVVSVTDRKMTVNILAGRLQAGGPRRYALDVVNGAAVSNAAGLTVVQTVDLTGAGGCPTPGPLGVAIDGQRNLAVVSEPGTASQPCSNVSIINLANGTGQTVAVGTSPVGIGILPQAGLAVVANSGSNSASIVDIVAATVVATVATDVSPTGVAIDPVLGEAVVAATGANLVDLFTVSASPGAVTTVSAQQRPVGVAVDPVRHLAAVGNTTSNSLSIIDLQASTATAAVPITSPAGVAFDPFSRDFLVAGSLTNQVQVVDPLGQTFTPIRVGVNPTSVAVNFASSTMVTTNNLSKTMTVVDFLNQRVRAVLPVTASNAFSVEIHPFTNLAVIADTANNRVLLFPLPR